MGIEDERQPNNFYICINMIGKEMQTILYALNTKRPLNSKMIQAQFRYSIFDYWDYYYFPNKTIDEQINIIFNKFYQQKGALSLNFRECLLVRAKNKNAPEIKTILEKINDINRVHYMPMVLFLLDEYDKDCFDYSEKKIVPDSKLYPKIDPRMIFTQGFQDIQDYSNYLSFNYNQNIDEKIIKNIKKFKNILIRFCSYHNELGDYFSLINSQSQVLVYDLIGNKKYPMTYNFCCVGRFGKGKSTGVNCLLGEKKAKESRSGTATTKKINYYYVKNSPIKIIDIPGFESKETVNSAVLKFQEYGDKINYKKGEITAILYFIKATDERMFAEMEYKMFKEIIKHENTPVIYILTHASLSTDKSEIYDMLNTGVKGVLKKHPEEDGFIVDKIIRKMFASEKNCVFVNFYPEDDEPIFGVDDFFAKIQSLCD
jgi:GTP-binding protein EngB required for normal cell division